MERGRGMVCLGGSKEQKRRLGETKGRLLVGLLFLVFAAFAVRFAAQEEYVLYSQFSFGGGGYRQTVLNVVVRWGARDEEVAARVVAEHRKVNQDRGTDWITVRLYRSARALKRGDCYREISYGEHGTDGTEDKKEYRKHQ